MTEAVFLSASVPDPKRTPEYARTADAVAIQAAVSALVYVTLGRRLLVWGGHPAITPMIWVIAADMGVDYGAWVRLYQSEHFRDEFPEDNARFQNVTYTPEVGSDRERSLLQMREQMFQEHRFSAAVFIGGMSGIIAEHNLFRQWQPHADVIPVISTGGATLDVAERVGVTDEDLATNLDYIALFHRRLNIPVTEKRHTRLEEQS